MRVAVISAGIVVTASVSKLANFSLRIEAVSEGFAIAARGLSANVPAHPYRVVFLTSLSPN
jgi:hypothetical protein